MEGRCFSVKCQHYVYYRDFDLQHVVVKFHPLPLPMIIAGF